MDKPLVAWVTTGFPYGKGEQFIQTELDAWRSSGARVVFVPTHIEGDQRELPTGFEVDDCLATAWRSRSVLARAAAKALVDPVLRRELAELRSRGALDRQTLRYAVRFTAQARMVETALHCIASRRGTIDIAYTYWLKPHTSGAVLARDGGAVHAVVGRAHGTDLYEEARPAHYNSLVRTVARRADRIFPISEQGRDYLTAHYGMDPSRVRVGRLGVEVPDPDIVAPAGAPDRVELISVSSMTPLKRLDLMVEGIARAAEELRGVATIGWRHYGSGPLQDEVERLVRERLVPLGVEWTPCGHLPHAQLLAAIASDPVDMMLNVSSSEGVPVSIMEAQVRGIPCLATDVGATREVLGEDSPYLLPAAPSAEDIGSRILGLLMDARSSERRRAVRAIVADRFDAACNFPEFVGDVLSLARGDE